MHITSQAGSRLENHIFENIQLLDDQEATERLDALRTLRKVSAIIEEKKHAKSR